MLVSLKFRMSMHKIHFFLFIDLQPPPPGLIYTQPPPSVMMYPPTPMVVQPLGGFLGHNSQTIQCPSCRQQVVTQVQYEAGTATWLIAFLICFFGGVIGCCLIPFCVPSCQDAVHTCPACHNLIGRRSPF
jgi:lipopolysaccharide-induced tumor necrosis factor-alpha factor